MICKKGFRLNFLGCTKYGVSCNSAFVLSALTGFLWVERNYKSCTNTNHNNNLSRHKLVIGGNNDKTISIYLIDIGLLKKAEIAHDLFRPAYISSNYLVLRLASVDIVHDILTLDFPYSCSQIILSYTLLSMWEHLASVNIKEGLTSKERICMLWSSYFFVLHVYRFGITTKRKRTYESVSLPLLIMPNEVIRPHHLTSVPSDH